MCVCALCRAPQTEVPEEEGGRLAQRHVGFFLSPCLSVVPPPRVGLCVGDGRTNRGLYRRRTILAFSSLMQRAGDIPSAPPPPAAPVRPVWTRVFQPCCVCVLFLFWACSCLCAKRGGLGHVLRLHVIAAQQPVFGLGSWVLGLVVGVCSPSPRALSVPGAGSLVGLV